MIFKVLGTASAAIQHCHTGTGRCYWLSDAADGTWEQGRAACQSEGGDLAVMEIEELFNYVIGAIRYEHMYSHDDTLRLHNLTVPFTNVAYCMVVTNDLFD